MYNLLLCATVFSLFYCSFITCEGLTKIPSSLQPPIAGPFPPTFFCSTQSGILPTDGTQKILGGESCSSTPQGVIPSTKKMVSSLIVSPTSGTTVEISKGIDILVHTRNLATGFFDDPNTRYYLTPQTLDPVAGIVEGHQHVTVQKLESATVPPAANKFDFFKGLNDEASQEGILQVTIPPNTLKTPGIYRICSITGSHGHQPVLMPPIPRGPQDDCVRINVVSGSVGNNSTSAAAQVVPPPSQESNKKNTSNQGGNKGSARSKGRNASGKNG